MNINSSRNIIVTATAASICTIAVLTATPAQATTDTGGDGTSTASAVEIDQAVVIAKRKMQMAADYLAKATAPAGFTAPAATNGSSCKP